MPMSNFPNGFANGVSIRGVPVEIATSGKVFWVNNSSVLAEDGIGGSNSNDGTYKRPFSTIDYAVGKCTAYRGDVIMVMPGHVENITTASAIDIDVAGVRVVGLGNGSKRPKIQFDHANASVTVGADDVIIENINFRASVTIVSVGLEIEDGADNVVVRNCVFDVDAATVDEFLVSIRLNDASNAALIEGNIIDMDLGGAVAAVSMTKDTDRTVIRNNTMRGDYSTAVINGITTLSTRLDIDSNVLVNGDASNIGTEPGIELLTGTTGVIRNNLIVCNLATKAAAVVADTCMLFNNYYNEDISGSATGGIIGTASADD